MATPQCPACGNPLAAGEFCGSCGAWLSAGSGRQRLRLGAHAVAPRERVIRQWLASSIFPQLPARARRIFGVALMFLAVALAGSALLRWQAPMIATATFGLPILFFLYLREIDALGDLRVRDVILVTVLGLALGVVWGLVVGPVVAEAYNAAAGAQPDVGKILRCGVAVPVAAAILLFIPAVVVRVLDRSSRESLDGFAVGALSAMVVNATATATLLVPQLALGLEPTTHEQSVAGLLAESVIEGLAWPLVSLAIGGIVGIALWFTPRANGSRRLVPIALLMVLVVLTAMWLVDVAPIPFRLYLGLLLLTTVSAVLAVRIVIAAALLREAHDDTDGTEQLRCAECDHVVGRTAFCASCGVAIRALSRSSRAARLMRSPEHTAGPSARPARRAGYLGVLGPLAVGVGIAAAAAVAVAEFLTPAPEPYACPPACTRPPLGTPVETNPRFTGGKGAFSVSYPGAGSAYQATFDLPGRSGVELKYLAGDKGILTLFGEPAGGRTAEKITEEIIGSDFYGATVAYPIPNASLGYQPGYGVVADLYTQGPLATRSRSRVVVLVAIKNDYALIASAVGPYHQFSPAYGNGQPSGTDLELAMDMGGYVNSFRWKGDGPL